MAEHPREREAGGIQCDSIVPGQASRPPGKAFDLPCAASPHAPLLPERTRRGEPVVKFLRGGSSTEAGASDEATRLHRAYWWLGDGVAHESARANERDAGNGFMNAAGSMEIFADGLKPKESPCREYFSTRRLYFVCLAEPAPLEDPTDFRGSYSVDEDILTSKPCSEKAALSATSRDFFWRLFGLRRRTASLRTFRRLCLRRQKSRSRRQMGEENGEERSISARSISATWRMLTRSAPERVTQVHA
jgi:hypothetical protein